MKNIGKWQVRKRFFINRQFNQACGPERMSLSGRLNVNNKNSISAENKNIAKGFS